MLFAFGELQAETIILHLKTGDRIAGTIVTEDTNRVLITTTWIKELAIPAAQIERREAVPAAAVAQKTNATTPPTPTVTEQKTNAPVPAPAVAEQKTNAPAPPAPAVAEQKPKPAGQPAITNIVPSAAAGTPVAVMPVLQPKPKTPKPKRWKGEVKVGADFLFGAKEQQIYYGRFKLVYERPYEANPKQFFRNILDYGIDYGRTDGIMSANRMDVSDKTDFDIGKRKIYVYNLAGVGYDEIRLIDLRYEEGPGIGYHLFTRTNFVMNVEAGFNYQVQYRSSTPPATDTTLEKFYYRFAEDITLKLSKRFTFTEKLEFFPQVEDVQQFRARFEATLSYGFWQNLALNLSVLDMYDTRPAKGIPKNDLQIRSSLGITF